MLLNLDKSIRGEICHAVGRYVNVITNTLKTMIEIKNIYILSIGI